MYSVYLYLLLGSLVEVFSQTDYPYISFMGDPLPNNTYVNIGQLGTTEGYSLYCETDPVVCCSGIGSWYPPNSDNIENVDSISMHRTSGKVELRCRNSGECPSGIYDCDIPVLIGHDSKFSNVYVGIYNNGGGGILKDY